MADVKQVNSWREISNSWQLTGELLWNNYFQLGGSEPANNLRKKLFQVACGELVIIRLDQSCH